MFLEYFAFRPPVWKSWKNYNDINIIHLAESGQLKKIAKERGVKELKTTDKPDAMVWLHKIS